MYQARRLLLKMHVINYTPCYLNELCSLVSTVSNLSALRSAARGDLVVPRTRLQLGNQAFVWLVRSLETVSYWVFFLHLHYQLSKHAPNKSFLTFLLH